MPPTLLEAYRSGTGHSVPPAAAGQVEQQKAGFDLPVRALGELFPGIESVEVTIPASQIYRQHNMVLPLAELLTLSAICKHTRPLRIFEIGTYTGSSTLLMAMSAPSEVEIFTLDLDPYEGVDHPEAQNPQSSIVGSSYRGMPLERNIHQLLGDSLTFDYKPFHNSIDLVLIDANHTYDFVKADTEKAFRLLRPGGIIIWDDYVWDPLYPECIGVSQRVHELAESHRINQIAGTRLAIYVDDQSGRDEKVKNSGGV